MIAGPVNNTKDDRWSKWDSTCTNLPEHLTVTFSSIASSVAYEVGCWAEDADLNYLGWCEMVAWLERRQRVSQRVAARARPLNWKHLHGRGTRDIVNERPRNRGPPGVTNGCGLWVVNPRPAAFRNRCVTGE